MINDTVCSLLFQERKERQERKNKKRIRLETHHKTMGLFINTTRFMITWFWGIPPLRAAVYQLCIGW